MKVAVVYLHVIGLNDGFDSFTEQVSGTYQQSADRFAQTYKANPAGIEHDLIVVGAKGDASILPTWNGMGASFIRYDGEGWCTGAHQHVCRQIEHDMVVLNCARTHFFRGGWLKRIVDCWNEFGPGIYGTMSNAEQSMHLRTNCYAISPKFLADYAISFGSRQDTLDFEHGKWNVSAHFRKVGMPSKLVTWDGCWSFEDWRTPGNIFRRGDQSNCIVLDRHTQIYHNAPDYEKRRLEHLADVGDEV